ncbi:hypothetical protein GE21DRAFT_1340576 [Neurospora crassa]|nr:hypothetical protein GE21DRAFT_1340576 [Neurospora crassa]
MPAPTAMHSRTDPGRQRRTWQGFSSAAKNLYGSPAPLPASGGTKNEALGRRSVPPEEKVSFN